MSSVVGSVGEPEEVADLVRRAIDEGEFAPNQRLVEADLSERFGASRGSVRTALLQLGGEGLVERVQNRGARVRAVSLAEAIEITEVRMVLEGLCAAKAADRLTEDDRDRLRGIGTAMQAAVESGDLLGYSELNRQLHALIRTLGGQSTAQAILERLRGQNVRHQFRLALHPGRAAVSLPQHLEIIDAICAGDPERAEAAVRRHLHSVIETLPQSSGARPAPELCPARPPRPDVAQIVDNLGDRTAGSGSAADRAAGRTRGGSMRTVVVTDPPRADVGDAETLGELRRGHRARGARPGRLPRPGVPARLAGRADRRHRGHGRCAGPATT